MGKVSLEGHLDRKITEIGKVRESFDKVRSNLRDERVRRSRSQKKKNIYIIRGMI